MYAVEDATVQRVIVPSHTLEPRIAYGCSRDIGLREHGAAHGDIGEICVGEVAVEKVHVVEGAVAEGTSREGAVCYGDICPDAVRDEAFARLEVPHSKLCQSDVEAIYATSASFEVAVSVSILSQAVDKGLPTNGKELSS